MSLPGVLGLMSGGGGGGLMSGGGGLYSEIECIMGNGHMGPPPPDRMMTDRHD